MRGRVARHTMDKEKQLRKKKHPLERGGASENRHTMGRGEKADFPKILNERIGAGKKSR